MNIRIHIDYLRLAMISYLLTSLCTSNHSSGINMEIKLWGRKAGASHWWCIFCKWKCVCEGKTGQRGCWEIPKLPISINQLQFTVGLLTSNITSCHNKCACVWLHLCVDWACFMTWIQYVTLGARWHIQYVCVCVHMWYLATCSNSL